MCMMEADFECKIEWGSTGGSRMLQVFGVEYGSEWKNGCGGI